MILSRCCRHDILFLSHFHLPISTPTTFQLSTWWQGVGEGYLRKCALMLVVKEWELKGSLLLTCIKLSKKKSFSGWPTGGWRWAWEPTWRSSSWWSKGGYCITTETASACLKRLWWKYWAGPGLTFQCPTRSLYREENVPQSRKTCHRMKGLIATPREETPTPESLVPTWPPAQRPENL